MPVAKTPLIYISYGLTKSGSTLAFELTKIILEQNDFPQKRLSREAIPADMAENFVPYLSAEQLEAIEREVVALGYPIVLKTHQPPSPEVQAWVQEGRIYGHCVYRDLREIALSMMDHGARARAEGSKGFANIQSLDNAIRSIRKQVPRFLEWSRLPDFISLYYDDVAFDTQATVRRLCAQLGLDADPAQVEQIAKGERFTQYNKAIPGRARELTPEASERILIKFRSFYEDVIYTRGAPERPTASLGPMPAAFVGKADGDWTKLKPSKEEKAARRAEKEAKLASLSPEERQIREARRAEKKAAQGHEK